MKTTIKNCGADRPIITVKVSRKSSTQEWVVRARNHNEELLLEEYFTDDKADANGTAKAIYARWDAQGFAAELTLA